MPALFQETKMAEKWMQKAFSKNKGKLHRRLGVKQGKKIPRAKLEAASHSKNSSLRHEAQAALNANPTRRRRKTIATP